MQLSHVISENREHEEIKSKILGKTRSRTSRRPASLDAQLVNGHYPCLLASKIVRIDNGQLGDDELVGGTPTQSPRVPTRRKWDHCDICLQLTGMKVYFGGSAQFKQYHLNAKWVHVLFDAGFPLTSVKARIYHALGFPTHSLNVHETGELDALCMCCLDVHALQKVEAVQIGTLRADQGFPRRRYPYLNKFGTDIVDPTRRC